MPEILFSTNKNIITRNYNHEEFEEKLSFFLSKREYPKLNTKVLIKIFNILSTNWQKKNSNLYQLFKDYNMGFLLAWLKEKNIKEMLDISFGNYSSLDKPTKLSNKIIVNAPKGVLVHWISGNVPILGVISLFQGIITKNINIIKVPTSFKTILPLILEDLKVSEFTIDNKVFCGIDLLKSVLVVYVDKDDTNSQSYLSKIADLRIAWGGKDAINSIVNLEKKIDCEDLIMGPKTSLSVISEEYLKDTNLMISTAEKIVRDVFTFDQMGCNSPHNFYIETSSIKKIDHFANILLETFKKESSKRDDLIKQPIDTYNIQCERVLYSIESDCNVKFDENFNFNIFVDYKNRKASSPLFNRSIFLKMVDSVNDAPKFFPNGLQTVGVAISENKFKNFFNNAIFYGALRFTKIGSMGVYDIPWDGILPLTRMVKWIPIPNMQER